MTSPIRYEKYIIDCLGRCRTQFLKMKVCPLANLIIVPGTLALQKHDQRLQPHCMTPKDVQILARQLMLPYK